MSAGFPSSKKILAVRMLALAALVLASLGQATPAHAAGIVVNDGGDSTNACATTGTGTCTLRDAITYANANAGPDTITFDGDYTITPGSLLPDIGTAMAIDGSGHSIAVDGNNDKRLFYLTSTGDLSLTHVIISNGFEDGGGAIWVSAGGTLSLTDANVSGSTTTTAGGGAAISSRGDVTISGSSFTNNASEYGGAAIYNFDGGTLDVTNSTFASNAVVACNSTPADDVAVTTGNSNVTGTTSTFTSYLTAGSWVSFGTYDSVPYLVGSVTSDTAFTLDKYYTGASSASTPIFTCSAAGSGGAIYNTNGGTATVTDSTFSGNSAGSGGAIHQDSTGTLTLSGNNLFEHNQAIFGGGGAIYVASGDVSLTGATFSHNSGFGGGAVDNDTGGGAVTVSGSTFTGNSSVLGGAIYNASAGGTATVSGSTFTENASFGGGAALNNAGVTLDASTSTFSGNAVLDCETPGETVAVTNGSADVTGTGTSFTSYLVAGNWVDFGATNSDPYRVASVADDTHFTLTSNYTGADNPAIDMFLCYPAYQGGAIYNTGGGTATVTGSTFSGNSANSGGAIYNDTSSLAIITGSTFAGNTADPVAAGAGGAIYDYEGTTYVTNSTLNANSANSGGGIKDDYGTVTVTNSTLSGNSASGNGGGVGVHGSLPGSPGSIGLTNTIITDSTGGNCVEEIDGTITDGGNNLEWGSGSPSTTCGVSTTSLDPLLGPLQNNGGGTQTMALLAGSPALNAGNDTVCNDTANAWSVNAVDQRGVRRPQGLHCDAGAFEVSRTFADFDGLGTSDLGIYRPSNGVWYIKGIYNQGWGGQTGDVPVPGDYNGDGKTDVGIYRPSTGVFYVKNVYNQGWGGQVGDVPVPGDYNGDGKTDVAIWRPSTGVFYVKYVFNSGWGQAGDIPVPGDYNGDGTTDVAVYRPSNNVWYIKGVGNFTWGNSGDVPVPGDYNGDGTTDIAVWRPSTGTWYVRGQPPYLVWGSSTDTPVPGDYDGDGKTDLAVYIPSSGTWSVKGQFNTVWGAVGDYPVEAPDTNGDGDPYQ